MAHVPEEPHIVALVEPATQAPPEQQNPPLHVPSVPPPHAEVHVPLLPQVGVAPLQALHEPEPPHAPFCVPGWQWVPSQQPPLQARPPEQVLAHVALLWHAVFAGQSDAAPQPHATPPSHTCPFDEFVQSAHAPLAPHSLFAVPATQAPVAEQQPPLHALVPDPHEVEQVWLVLLHAWPDGQSVAALHPQVPVERQA